MPCSCKNGCQGIAMSLPILPNKRGKGKWKITTTTTTITTTTITTTTFWLEKQQQKKRKKNFTTPYIDLMGR